MKWYLCIIFIGFFYGFGQRTFPDDGYVSRAGNYALINDFKNLDFDNDSSRVTFNFIEDNTTGTIGGLDFNIQFNPEDPDNASFVGSAQIKTLDTNNFLRDGHLMWKKFFYKTKYPKIFFNSTHVIAFGNHVFKVIGDLTIKGIKNEIIITFTLNDNELTGTTSINTSNFDIHIHDERKKNKLDIQFHFPILK
ncbi:YceI family protein [Aquimarina sp. U1-2]|uniref:YceI family protein n=1 Tax=Aquimarina sp. U1-2 TaxID=2823141 RepID=UPI001AECEE15|nr:YceI family protein [Aquimarina sp. U1-2]MBP2831920.1 YceI family protein [Aquimarina sp. U1-2]